MEELVTPNFIKKTITIRTDKENQLFTYKQIKSYSEQVLNTLHKDSKMIVKGESILRDTTLKDYNDDFLSQEEYDEHAQVRTRKRFNKV